MKKKKKNSPKTTTAPARPSFFVETSLAEVVAPKIDAWLDDLANAIPRVIEDTDEEAVHDLRVAMRRIRSLLKVVRPVFGQYYVKLIRDEFKKVADATGALRDEEVMAETFGALSLDEGHRDAWKPWLARRQQREKVLRSQVVQLLRDGALEAPMTHLRALIRLPVPPGQDKEAHKFARRTVLGAHFEVESLRTANVQDKTTMHDLRIAYKRLRYAVEALSPVLPPELRAWGSVATKFQKVLGNIHDHDVALEVVGADEALPAATRTAVIEALEAKRDKYARQYLELVGLSVKATPAEPGSTVEQDKGDKKKRKESKANETQTGGESVDESTSNPPSSASPAAPASPATKTAPAKTRRSRNAARKVPAKKAAKAPAKANPRKRASAKKTQTSKS